MGPDDTNFEDFTCDFSNEDPQKEHGKFHDIFTALLYCIVFVIGVMGNGLVLYILLRRRHLRSSTDNFLVHLAIADLLMLFTLPFGATNTLVGWVFGDCLCKTVRVISLVNFYCSSLLLGCISIDRYLSIIYAINTFRKQRYMTVHMSCFCVWFICFLLSLPNLFILGATKVGNNTHCGYYEGNFATNIYWQVGRFLNHLVGFLIPLIFMIFCYSHIIMTLYRSPRREKKRAVRVAILITSVFFLCWTPYNIVIFVDTLYQLAQIKCNVNPQKLHQALILTELLGCTHSCLNPVLYAFVGVKFRNDALLVLTQITCFKSKVISKLNTLQRKGSTIDSESGTIMSSF